MDEDSEVLDLWFTEILEASQEIQKLAKDAVRGVRSWDRKHRYQVEDYHNTMDELEEQVGRINDEIRNLRKHYFEK